MVFESVCGYNNSFMCCFVGLMSAVEWHNTALVVKM